MPPPYPGISGFTGYSGGGFAAAGAAPIQAGYVDPNNPNTAYIPPPPPQNEQPPSYDESVKKNN